MLENDLSKNKRFPASNSSNISSEFSNINKHEPTKFPVKSNLLWALYDFPETWTQVLTLLSLDHFLTYSQSDVTWPRNVISTEHPNIQQTVVLPCHANQDLIDNKIIVSPPMQSPKQKPRTENLCIFRI